MLSGWGDRAASWRCLPRTAAAGGAAVGAIAAAQPRAVRLAAGVGSSVGPVGSPRARAPASPVGGSRGRQKAPSFCLAACWRICAWSGQAVAAFGRGGLCGGRACGHLVAVADGACASHPAARGRRAARQHPSWVPRPALGPLGLSPSAERDCSGRSSSGGARRAPAPRGPLARPRGVEAPLLLTRRSCAAHATPACPGTPVRVAPPARTAS